MQTPTNFDQKVENFENPPKLKYKTIMYNQSGI
jgi:hypothetical protein